MNKEERIKKEYTRLKGLYKDIAPNKMKLVDNLIKNAAYMAVTLEDLQDQVNREGAVVTRTLGTGIEKVEENPAQKSYTALINRFQSVTKQLADLLPEQAGKKSKLEAFLEEAAM